MRKISIIAFLASFFIAFQSHALSGEEIMKRTAANVNGAPSMTFRFTATTGDGARTTGTLTMCRSRFVMQTAVQSVWYDGRSLWSYAPSAGETNLSELAALAEQMGAPALPGSGRQEYLNSVVNSILFN